jgi:hypothetical protein
MRVSCAWNTCAAGTRLATCPTVCVSLVPRASPASARSFFACSTSTLRSGTAKNHDVPDGIHWLTGCANPRPHAEAHFLLVGGEGARAVSATRSRKPTRRMEVIQRAFDMLTAKHFDGDWRGPRP